MKPEYDSWLLHNYLSNAISARIKKTNVGSFPSACTNRLALIYIYQSKYTPWLLIPGDFFSVVNHVKKRLTASNKCKVWGYWHLCSGG